MEKGLTLALAIVCKAELKSSRIPSKDIDGYHTALDFIAKELKKEYSLLRKSKSTF